MIMRSSKSITCWWDQNTICWLPTRVYNDQPHIHVTSIFTMLHIKYITQRHRACICSSGDLSNRCFGYHHPKYKVESMQHGRPFPICRFMNSPPSQPLPIVMINARPNRPFSAQGPVAGQVRWQEPQGGLPSSMAGGADGWHRLAAVICELFKECVFVCDNLWQSVTVSLQNYRRWTKYSNPFYPVQPPRPQSSMLL